MAGNTDFNSNSKSNSNSSASKPKPIAKSFLCTGCGAPVTIRYPGASLSVVCPNCHSVMDATNENYRILSTAYARSASYVPLLELGSRGKLKGRTWEVIGYMVRSDVVSHYDWNEYLLFNPYYGFRWLTEDAGHWNFVTTVKRKPELTGGDVIAILDERKYKLFNTGRTQVDYVLGEFYWRVAVGSYVRSTDYIDPPQMLSMEKDEKEVIWSVAEYIPAEQIQEAFKAKKLPLPTGVSATQPATALELWKQMRLLLMIFCAVITCAQVCITSQSLNAGALTYSNQFAPNTKRADITTPVFELIKNKANVEIDFHAPVSNSWFFVSGELVNNTTGESFPFDKSIEFYSGTDSDGYWSEGGDHASVLISSVPQGKYYINFDTESGEFKTPDMVTLDIAVKRDVPSYDNYFWTLLWLCILPAISWMKMRQVEVARWSNSDFSPYATTASD
jgi:Domain of unknown function (DUF4178)